MPNNAFSARGYTSTTLAAQRLNCSKNHLYECFEDGRLEYKEFTWGKRKIRMVRTSSLLSYSRLASQNNRIGRDLYSRPRCRQPYVSKGYRYIYKPEHQRANSNGYVPEHYLVAEETLKRPLTKEEVVHHINHDRSDNSPSNLLVYGNQGQHMSVEHSQFLSCMYKVRGNPDLEAKVISYINSLLSSSPDIIIT